MRSTTGLSASQGQFRSARGLKNPQRRGNIIVLFALFLIALMGVVAMAVDLGYIVATDTELERAVDAGALAGAGVLVEGAGEADTVVRQFIQANRVGNRDIQTDDIEIEVGHWNEDTKTFTPEAFQPSSIRVHVDHLNQPLFFGRVFGKDKFDLQAEAIAMYQPRDIMIVLDFSSSMNYDSQLMSIGVGALTQSSVQQNLLDIYNELGHPTFGNMQWNPVTISSSYSVNQVKTQLGLRVNGNDIAYPYPSGSWTDYVNYVKKSSSNNLPTSYRHKYGYMTWANYLLDLKEAHAHTPDLWKTSEQPVKAVKDAVTLYLAYLQEVETDDRVGLVVYTSTDQTAKLESGLTHDFDFVGTITQQRQAGHYTSLTNISAGMTKARQELVNNGRAGAFKMVVLMTDGQANVPGNATQAKNAVVTEAGLLAAARIPAFTISLGAGADTALMDQVAQMTKGFHFNIPGGQTVAQYEEDLKDAFRAIADDRPLKLVK